MERCLLGLCTLFVQPGRFPKVAVAVRASTLLKFHQYLVRRKYRGVFSGRRTGRKSGPKDPSEEIVQIILELKRRNPRSGCPKIPLIVSTTFGVDIDKDVVRRVLAKHLRPPSGGGGPSWLTVIDNAKDSLWSLDLFCCESIMMRTHWVLVVVDQFTRRIIGFAVHVGDVDGLALCRMFNRVLSAQALRRHLSTDHDPLWRCSAQKSYLRTDHAITLLLAQVNTHGEAHSARNVRPPSVFRQQHGHLLVTTPEYPSADPERQDQATNVGALDCNVPPIL